MSSTSRARRAVMLTAVIGIGALLAGCAGDGGADVGDGGDTPISGNIIWADYGGPTNESRSIAYFDSFYDETGVEVISASLEDSIARQMLEGEEGDYDFVQVSTADALAFVDHRSELPEAARGDLVMEELRPYVAGGFYIGIGQGWLTDTFPDGGPQDWVDFFDVEKFPGKRAWPGSPGSFDGSFEIALLADGVPFDELYPLDLERATKKLDSIRDHLVFYQSYPEVQQLLTSRSVSIAVTVTGQFVALQNAGEDVTIQWNQMFQALNGFIIPEKAPNPDAAFALAEWINDPERQAVFVERTLYGPTNSKVFDYLPEDVAERVVNAPGHADKLLKWDEHWRAENEELLLNTYTAWLAG